MPWQVKELLTMKREFVMLAQADGTNIAELCRRFGISRECGYKWLRAYQEVGELGLRGGRPQAQTTTRASWARVGTGGQHHYRDSASARAAKAARN